MALMVLFQSQEEAGKIALCTPPKYWISNLAETVFTPCDAGNRLL